MACNCGLLWRIYGLLYGIVACYFGLLGVPGVEVALASPSCMMIAHCFWLWSMCLCTGLTVRSSSAVRRAVESRSELMKCAWMQKDMCEYSRWQFRKYIRHQRKLEVQRANWQAYSDAGGDAQQVKSLGLPTELSALQAGVFELRAWLLEDDIGRLRSLASLQPTDAGMLLSTDFVEGLQAEVMYLIRGVDSSCLSLTTGPPAWSMEQRSWTNCWLAWAAAIPEHRHSTLAPPRRKRSMRRTPTATCKSSLVRI